VENPLPTDPPNIKTIMGTQTSSLSQDTKPYKDVYGADDGSSAASSPLLQQRSRRPPTSAVAWATPSSSSSSYGHSRRGPLPPKTTVAAAFMFIAGSVFLVAGLYIYFMNLRAGSDRGLAMVLLGLLMFTPGSYASFVLYGAYHGWAGYDYNQIPSYDEDY
jgi:hypothetical protein